MQDDIDMEPLHKLFIYRKKLVKPYIERLLKWMDGITYMMSALFILTLVYEHGFLISFEEMEMINTLYHFVWIVFLVDISLHLLLNYSDTKRKYRGLAWILSLMLYLTLIPVIFHEPEVQGGIHDFWSFFHSRLYHVVLLTLLSLLMAFPLSMLCLPLPVPFVSRGWFRSMSLLHSRPRGCSSLSC